ncbi:MAG: HAD-IIA family hydrolase [Thermodesulfobacteriota bacterium]
MNFIKCFDHFIFDLDGVVYNGAKPTKKSPQVLKKLRILGKKISFITNNPTRSPSEYVKKLNSMGIFSSKEEFITSPMAVGEYLITKHRKLKEKTAFVIGSSYLKSEVKKTGIQTLNGEKAYTSDFVILGGHSDFNYEEIKTASISIRNGAKFIATNKDSFYPSDSIFYPATGALLASVEVSSGTKAVTVGKPESYIFNLLKIRASEKILLIGDSLTTDILGGKKAGFATALTLTGLTKKDEIKKSKINPDYIIQDLSFLLK